MSALRSRPALVAALSCSLASTPPIAAQQVPTDSHHGLRSVLTRLDGLFDGGDVDAYLGAFQPDNPWAHAARQRRLQCLLSAEVRPTRVSRLVGEPRRIGDHTVVRVHHELRRSAHGEEIAWSEDTMLALRERADGGWLATLEVPIATPGHLQANDLFVCAACNFQIGGASGWLGVPMEPDWSHSLESVGFWLVGTDLVCEISVNVDGDAPSAERLAQRLAETMLTDIPESTTTPVTPWKPPGQDGPLPPHWTGARLEVSFPDELAADRSARAVLHVVASGPLQHILVARGSEAAMRQQAAALERLLHTYRLLKTNAATMAGLAPLLHHTGGRFEGTTYHNEIFYLRCSGPEGWTARHRCGGSAFHVQWNSRHGSSLEMIGHRRPPGVASWTPAKATKFVERLMESAHLTPCLDPTQFTWKKDPAVGGMACCITCAPPVGAAGAGGKKRALHLVVRDDVLILFDARIAEAADEAAATAAMRSLTLH